MVSKEKYFNFRFSLVHKCIGKIWKKKNEKSETLDIFQRKHLYPEMTLLFIIRIFLTEK